MLTSISNTARVIILGAGMAFIGVSKWFSKIESEAYITVLQSEVVVRVEDRLQMVEGRWYSGSSRNPACYSGRLVTPRQPHVKGMW